MKDTLSEKAFIYWSWRIFECYFGTLHKNIKRNIFLIFVNKTMSKSLGNWKCSWYFIYIKF